MILTLADGIPGVGNGGEEETAESKEEQEEQERLRQEAIKLAEIERRMKYKKQEEDRELMRQIIRDKVDMSVWNVADPSTHNPIISMIWYCWMSSFVKCTV